jgi:hypothetical protein
LIQEEMCGKGIEVPESSSEAEDNEDADDEEEGSGEEGCDGSNSSDDEDDDGAEVGSDRDDSSLKVDITKPFTNFTFTRWSSGYHETFHELFFHTMEFRLSRSL